MKKVLLAWSSGKDSAWTLHVLRSRNIEVSALLTTVNEVAERVAMHGVRASLLEEQAKSIGLPVWQIPLPWPCSNLEYEARMTACYVAEPAKLTAARMDRWCRDFDNWAIVDTACFAVFDRTPHAWKKVAQWARSRDEYVKRAAFALLWGLTVHDKEAPDARFLEGLALVEREASDERHWVKKAVNMALRATGKRNRALNAAAIKVAGRLAASGDPTRRWIGKDALRELEGYHSRKAVKETA